MSTWPRTAEGTPIWGEAPGELVSRIVPARRYEPMIVTTLRRYVRRGASVGLLCRLAGGTGNFRYLNRSWDLDGQGGETAAKLLPVLLEQIQNDGDRERAELLAPIGVELGARERRLALLQILAEFALRKRPAPTPAQLARALGVSEGTTHDDLDWLRGEGRVALSTAVRREGVLRKVRLLDEPQAVLA